MMEENSMTTLHPDNIHEAVRERYGRIATEFTPEIKATDGGCCDDGSGACCSSDSLYEFDLNDLPADVTQLSLGCGDPITLAALQPGQTVLDLGSGGGIDCFLAARQVGEGGFVIGVDMTPAMLEKAERNKAKMGYDNVDFRFGQIEDLPVDNDTVDVIISNCVINLSPDKTAVFREAFRVLRPGGRLAVSDMVTQGHFSPEERADMAAWSGCITGAEDATDYVSAIRAAGFTNISVQDKNAPDIELADSLGLYIGQARLFSARVTAVKPGM
jgi:SAM-dependent methyltransferase